jgi:hypothetical protein
MKITCSFSLLVRLLFWLSVFTFVVGVALGGTQGQPPLNGLVPVVGTHGEEVR